MAVNERLLASLLKTASTFVGGGYAGVSYRDLMRYGSYEEAGLKLVSDDIQLTQLYAGLAVFSSDLHSYLRQSPREDAAWFEEVINSVHSDEQRRYGPGQSSVGQIVLMRNLRISYSIRRHCPQ